LGIHGFGLRREAKRIRAGQEIEVRKRKFGTEKILLAVRQLALRNCQPDLDLRQGMRHNFLVGRNSKFGKDVPLVRDVVDHVGIEIGIYGADPLVQARAIAGIPWPQRRLRKGLLQIVDDGACLVNREITMLHDWDAVEGMQRQMAWLAHLRLKIMERVWHLLMREDEPHNVDEGAARKAVYNEFRHAVILR